MAAEYPPEQRPFTLDPPTQPARYPDTRPSARLTGVRGTYGAVLLAAFVLCIVGGIVATVWALQAMNNRVAGDQVEAVVGLVLGVVTIFAAILIWQGRHEIGGVFAIVTGIVFLVLGPDTAGIFAVLGGIMAIIANRVSDVVS